MPSATITDRLPRALAGTCSGSDFRISSPRYERSRTLMLTVLPGFTRVPSSHTRSTVALRDCSLASISSVSASISTSSNELRRSTLIGVTTEAAAPTDG